VISLAVRWYLRYGLSYRDVEELLAERGIMVDHVTVFRWVQRFIPEFIIAGLERAGRLPGRSADLRQQPAGFQVGRVCGQHAPERGAGSGQVSVDEGELRREEVGEQILP
jgi:hypothetical protein